MLEVSLNVPFPSSFLVKSLLTICPAQGAIYNLDQPSARAEIFSPANL